MACGVRLGVRKINLIQGTSERIRGNRRKILTTKVLRSVEQSTDLASFCVFVARVDRTMQNSKTRRFVSKGPSRPFREPRRGYGFHEYAWWSLVPQRLCARCLVNRRIHLRNGGVQALLPSARQVPRTFLDEIVRLPSVVAFEESGPSLVASEPTREVWYVLHR